MTIRNAAVLGAGGGGRASCVALGRAGIAVKLWEFPEFARSLDDIDGSLQAEGEINDTVKLSAVTTDMTQAVRDADLIVACVQRGAHRLIAATLCECMRDNQVLLLNPGSLGGALEIARIFRDTGREVPPFLCETATLTHCARPLPGGVQIGLQVRHVRFAALPAAHTAILAEALLPFYPGLVPAASVLETGLYCGNPIIHPPITVLNAACIEKNIGDFRFYADGLSPAVGRLIAALDTERQKLGEAFGLKLMPEPVMSQLQGYAQSADYVACYRDSAVFGPLAAPHGLDHRYMHEDVGEGLVTYLALAEVAGIRLPVIESVVHIAGVLAGKDYFLAMHERLRCLGLAVMTLEEIKRYTATGCV